MRILLRIRTQTHAIQVGIERDTTDSQPKVRPYTAHAIALNSWHRMHTHTHTCNTIAQDHGEKVTEQKRQKN